MAVEINFHIAFTDFNISISNGISSEFMSYSGGAGYISSSTNLGCIIHAGIYEVKNVFIGLIWVAIGI